MIFTSIWERYFIKQFSQVFFLFLFCFYGLYVLIDYASHTSALPNHQTQIKGIELARYYLFIFASRAEILIPLALLIALIKTLSSLNIHYELAALMAGGFKLHLLMRPFVLIGLFFTTLIYLNEQYLLPTALKKLKRIEDSNKHKKNHQHLPMIAQHTLLEDGSLFIFQSYDRDKEQFFDAYWIPSIDDIYRMKYFAPYQEEPVGYFVDHLVRQPSGMLEIADSFKSYPFKKMKFSQETLQSTIMDADTLSLTELWNQRPNQGENELSEKESKGLTALYWKLFIPWLCLLSIIAPAPFCVRFSRQHPLFFIYICGLFGLIAFYLLLDATQVVAKRQVLPPLLALGIPFLSLFGLFGWRFMRMR